MNTRTLAILGLMALIVATASAQPATRANIPFDFGACNQRMAAGAYLVTTVQPGVVRIASAEKGGGCMILTGAIGGGAPSRESKLVFNKYRNVHFLSQVWTAGSAYGRQLPKSKTEKEYAKLRAEGLELASTHVPLR